MSYLGMLFYNFRGKSYCKRLLMFSKDIDSVLFILLTTTFFSAIAVAAGVMLAIEWFANQIQIF